MKIRAIIVDDEPLARERVRMLLREELDVEVVAECENGRQAVEQIGLQHPELLFLDVQMPEMDGFEVLQNTPAERLPVVIFTTAFDQHAVRAFDAHALDYLLKPFKPARFKAAVQRAREYIANKQADKTAANLLAMLAERVGTPGEGRLTRLTIKTDDRVLVVNVEDIDSIESAGNYVVVHVGKTEHILRDTLTALEAKLPNRQFLRVSRAAIVNLDRVRELQPMFQGENVVILKSGRAIPTTRSLREIQEKLESH
jgi:two-component system, LytTR family, response regulator